MISSRISRFGEQNSRSRLEAWDSVNKILDLVSRLEIRWTKSRSRLEARDWKKTILDLVSKLKIGFSPVTAKCSNNPGTATAACSLDWNLTKDASPPADWLGDFEAEVQNVTRVQTANIKIVLDQGFVIG